MTANSTSRDAMNPRLITAGTRHLTASMVVIADGPGAVLLVWHAATGAYMFPGGHLDPDEAPHEAALREVREETGLQPTVHPTEPRIPLLDMTQLPAPWRVYAIPAPAKPARPGRPAEPAHTHIDCLYIGRADAAESPTPEASGATNRPGWFLIDQLPAPVRAEVPTVAAAALDQVRRDLNPTGDPR